MNLTVRLPYVGAGADGARRSAQIDREEAETLPTGPGQPGWHRGVPARREALELSARAWELQASALERGGPLSFEEDEEGAA